MPRSWTGSRASVVSASALAIRLNTVTPNGSRSSRKIATGSNASSFSSPSTSGGPAGQAGHRDDQSGGGRRIVGGARPQVHRPVERRLRRGSAGCRGPAAAPC